MIQMKRCSWQKIYLHSWRQGKGKEWTRGVQPARDRKYGSSSTGLGPKGSREGTVALVFRAEAIVAQERSWEGGGKTHPEASLSLQGSCSVSGCWAQLQASHRRCLDDMALRVCFQGTEKEGRKEWMDPEIEQMENSQHKYDGKIWCYCNRKGRENCWLYNL